MAPPAAARPAAPPAAPSVSRRPGRLTSPGVAAAAIRAGRGYTGPGPGACGSVRPPLVPASAGSAPSRRDLPRMREEVNTFLSQDPSLKARRLARALISDMVVYHPGKRQDGLRDGTLKELFEDEIKKSWEEYADQVGRDIADSTPYFKEALNEILAGGRQIF